MNLLAHIYLSGNTEKILTGNFIADEVKGKQYLQYEPDIQKGIFLHRKIDTFTDNNEIVKRSVRKLRTRFNKYAPVIADIFYDHFLALNWHHFTNIPLTTYVHNRYKVLTRFRPVFPDSMKKVLDAMIENDWLSNYANINGIEKSLSGIAGRASFETNFQNGIRHLLDHYQYYQEDFLTFFPRICNYVEDILQNEGLRLEPEIL